MKKCSKCKEVKEETEFYKRGKSYRSHCKCCFKLKQELNKEIKSEYDKQHYLKNKEIIDARAKEYAQQNKERKKNYDANYAPIKSAKLRERYQTDLNYKLKCNLRSRLHNALKRNKKIDKTMNLLGCSIAELKVHIQSQFTQGMTWDNVMNGKIHIDHIIPCVSFDFTDPEQQRKCFHYTNLQPLWAEDNLAKRDKIK